MQNVYLLYIFSNPKIFYFQVEIKNITANGSSLIVAFAKVITINIANVLAVH